MKNNNTGDGNTIGEMQTKQTIAICVQKRIIPIVDKINQQIYNQTRDIVCQLLLQGAPDVKIFIDSDGGDVDSGLDIFDLIDTYPGKSTGVVFRMAASMATTVLQACDLRLCAKHADIMIHYISRNKVLLNQIEFVNSKSLQRLRRDMLRQQNAIYGTLAKHSQKITSEIREKCRKETYMKFDEAKRFGLVDGILSKKQMAEWFLTSKELTTKTT